MAWEMSLLRRTRLGKHRRCLDTLEAYAEVAPRWQRGCLFFYAGLGTWLAMQLGVDVMTMWRKSESVLEDMATVTQLKPREIAEMLRDFAKVKLQHSNPIHFNDAKAAVYDQLFWPMAAHMAFALQPSAAARHDFVMRIADSMDVERARVADLGCGPAVILCSLLLRKPSWTGHGLDISKTAIDYATKLAAHKKVGDRTWFLKGDLVDLPYPNRSFDLVVVSEVLEHVPDVQKALRELMRVLRPEGRIVITVPLLSRTALHVHSLTGREDVSRLCDKAGLGICHFEVRQYPGFGDDWRHAFLVAQANGYARVERPMPVANTWAAPSLSLSKLR